MLMLGVPVGNDVVEDGEQWKLVFRRKRKTLLKTFQNSKDKAQSSFGTFGIPFGVSGPRPLQEASFLQIRLFLQVSFLLIEMPSVLFGLLALLERRISRMR